MKPPIEGCVVTDAMMRRGVGVSRNEHANKFIEMRGFIDALDRTISAEEVDSPKS